MGSAKDLSCDITQKHVFIILSFIIKPELLVTRLAQPQQEGEKLHACGSAPHPGCFRKPLWTCSWAGQAPVDIHRAAKGCELCTCTVEVVPTNT